MLAAVIGAVPVLVITNAICVAEPAAPLAERTPSGVVASVIEYEPVIWIARSVDVALSPAWAVTVMG